MNEKIKILFYLLDNAGVGLMRLKAPSIELERQFSNLFQIDIIDHQLDFNNPETVDLLKTYDIVQYHRELTSIPQMIKLKQMVKESGTIFVCDIDDFYKLDSSHPLYDMSIENKMAENILDQLTVADYVTTTTNLFKSQIIKDVKKDEDKVRVFHNSINPEWQRQFRNNWEPSTNGRVRIVWCGGSSHSKDIAELEAVVNLLRTDYETKNKFQMILVGFDCAGSTSSCTIENYFEAFLKKKGLWTQETINILNKFHGDADKIPFLNSKEKDLFRGKIFDIKQRDINSSESVYCNFEKILTDDYRLIQDQDYVKWLKNYERGEYENNDYKRIWTKPANIYAEIFDNVDIALAPLANNFFNQKKSNLKQVEAFSRKLPIVCSGIQPYTEDGRNWENCVLIPDKKNNAREWYRALKKLILNSDLRTQLGNQLHEDFKDKYNLKNVTAKRAEWYRSIVEKGRQNN